jgi:hypothetical protein
MPRDTGPRSGSGRSRHDPARELQPRSCGRTSWRCRRRWYRDRPHLGRQRPSTCSGTCSPDGRSIGSPSSWSGPERLEGRGQGDDPVPGDKSISHRALLLGVLAEGESRAQRAAPGGGLPEHRDGPEGVGGRRCPDSRRTGEIRVLRGGSRWAPLPPGPPRLRKLRDHGPAPAGAPRGIVPIRGGADRRRVSALPADAARDRAPEPHGGAVRGGAGRPASPHGKRAEAYQPLLLSVPGGERAGEECPPPGRRTPVGWPWRSTEPEPVP